MDEQKAGQSRNRLTEPQTLGSTAEVVNDSSEKYDFIYAHVAMLRKTKNGITKKVIVLGDCMIRGTRVRDINQYVKNGYCQVQIFSW